MSADAPAADLSALTTKDQRVHHIAGLMRANAWPAWPASRPFRQKLAEAWGVEDVTVRAYAAEAHRIVALDPDERAQLQQELGRRLLDIAEEARAAVNVQTGVPDFANAIRATETAAKFLGIELAADKLKISGGVSLASIDELRKALEDDETTG